MPLRREHVAGRGIGKRKSAGIHLMRALRQRPEVESWKLEVGSWKLEVES